MGGIIEMFYPEYDAGSQSELSKFEILRNKRNERINKLLDQFIDRLQTLDAWFTESPINPAHIHTPLLMILGGRDQLIDNFTAEKVFHQSPVLDKDLINYDDLDHLINQDLNYLPLISKDLTSWLNTHI